MASLTAWLTLRTARLAARRTSFWDAATIIPTTAPATRPTPIPQVNLPHIIAKPPFVFL